jgi:hypothetical protein
MNRNQKIAIGCGGAGCFGLFVLAVVAAGVYFYYQRQRPMMTNRNSNFSINSNRASNADSSSSSDDRSDDTPSSSSTSSSSSMSEDDKHKLFQAAGATSDSELILKVLNKIGFSSGTGSAYEEFVKDHFTWAVNNLEFINSVNTPEKARAYVEAHLDD